MNVFLIYAEINVILTLAELLQSMLERMDDRRTVDITRGTPMSPVAEGLEW